MKKNFFVDDENNCIINKWDEKYKNEIISKWNAEIPEHVQNFNSYHEDRNAIIYFALFIEYHINKSIELLFPDFNKFLDFSKTAINTKINILASFRLFPIQVFESCRCINNIRNEFAHEFSITQIEDLKNLNEDRKKKTVIKLINLTKEYEGDYEYEKVEDTLMNRFKSLCLNTATAFRIYEPLIKELREKIEN